MISRQCIFIILQKHLLMSTCTQSVVLCGIVKDSDAYNKTAFTLELTVLVFPRHHVYGFICLDGERVQAVGTPRVVVASYSSDAMRRQQSNAVHNAEQLDNIRRQCKHFAVWRWLLGYGRSLSHRELRPSVGPALDSVSLC